MVRLPQPMVEHHPRMPMTEQIPANQHVSPAKAVADAVAGLRLGR